VHNPDTKWLANLARRPGPIKVADLAAIMGVSQQKIYKMVANGEIPYLRIRGCIRFLPEQLVEWIKCRIMRPEVCGARKKSA
jgi:excisionase family DNA binding protein